MFCSVTVGSFAPLTVPCLAFAREGFLVAVNLPRGRTACSDPPHSRPPHPEKGGILPDQSGLDSPTRQGEQEAGCYRQDYPWPIQRDPASGAKGGAKR